MLGARDLRAFCRPPMGVPVVFAGVSVYPDDGSLICGLFDRPVRIEGGDQGYGGVPLGVPTVSLPFNAFSPMPKSRDAITVDGIAYTVSQPTADDDGAFTIYELTRVGL